MFKLAMGRLPTSTPLCSQSTISRLENLPDRRSLLRMGYGMIDFYCDSFRQVPQRIVLDIDGHFDGRFPTTARRSTPMLGGSYWVSRW
jgi:hypothetical protein